MFNFFATIDLLNIVINFKRNKVKVLLLTGDQKIKRTNHSNVLYRIIHFLVCNRSPQSPFPYTGLFCTKYKRKKKKFLSCALFYDGRHLLAGGS